jgi:hypothetical protein
MTRILAMLALGLFALRAEAQATWQACANEGQRCTPGSLPAEVRYGEPWGNKWTAPRTVAAAVDCNNATFGDPSPGTGKRCEWRPSGPPPPEVELRVSWAHATTNDDGSALTDRAGYRVERSAQESGPWATLATVGKDATSATQKAPAGRSCVRVVTLAGSGESLPSAPVCVDRPALGVVPVPPGDVSVSMRELALVSGSETGTRVVFGRTSQGSRGPRLGELKVGPVAQVTPPFDRVKCDARDTISAGTLRYARVIDPRVAEPLRGGYVTGCVSYGRQ